MKTTTLLLILPLTLVLRVHCAAQDAFEQPPTLSAAAILQPAYVSGPGFTVRDSVPTYAGRNGYIIDSDAGIFEADGNVMLVQREREIAAIGRPFHGHAALPSGRQTRAHACRRERGKI